ncbi:MAG: hypothetical protein Q8881_03440 [Sweet potato little leaf phytoplasma]|nr:hypothetical protein [Sweet potato little leaf phytoplasma]
MDDSDETAEFPPNFALGTFPPKRLNQSRRISHSGTFPTKRPNIRPISPSGMFPKKRPNFREILPSGTFATKWPNFRRISRVRGGLF